MQLKAPREGCGIHGRWLFSVDLTSLNAIGSQLEVSRVRDPREGDASQRLGSAPERAQRIIYDAGKCDSIRLTSSAGSRPLKKTSSASTEPSLHGEKR